MDFPANQYVPSSGIEWMEAANGDVTMEICHPIYILSCRPMGINVP
jgi:hypothetical protein